MLLPHQDGVKGYGRQTGTEMLRRFQQHRSKTDRDGGFSCRLIFPRGDLDRQRAGYRLLRQTLPQPPHFGLKQATVLSRPNEQVRLQGAGIIEELKDVRLSVAYRNHLDPGWHQVHGLFEGLKPLVALFLLDGESTTLFRRLAMDLLGPSPNRLTGQPQGKTGFAQDEGRMGE